MDIGEVKQAVCNVLTEMRERPIPVGVSNRHLHLSQKDYDCLFPNEAMSIKKELKQPGQYAANQTVTLVGPKGQLERVRILGPVRSKTQVEISKTDARTLGIPAPIRLSGDLKDSPGIKLVSDMGEVTIKQGVIVALRHIHMSPLDTLLFGVKHGDTVSVEIEGTSRKTVFEDVSIRVSPDMVLEMHLDTDEANAADADNPKAFAKILKVSP